MKMDFISKKMYCILSNAIKVRVDLTLHSQALHRKGEFMMLKIFAALILVLILAGCTQEGEIGLRNRTGGGASVDIDCSGYYLHPGELIVREIEIGRKCVFGPDETRVLVSGEGDCLFYFSDMVRVRDGEQTVLSLYGDAGLLTVMNDTPYALDLYLVDCSSMDWGSPCDHVPAGGQVTWKLSPGCWDVLGEAAGFADASASFNINVCDDSVFQIYSARYSAGHAHEKASDAGIVRAALGSGDDVKMKDRAGLPQGNEDIRRMERVE